MSGLIYHVTCPVCGATSPSISLARHPWESAEVALLASNFATGEIDVVMVRDTGDRVALAAARSTPEHPVSAVVVRANELVLEPPLPCPRDRTPIARATWGDAEATREPRASLDDLISASRTATDELARTSLDDRYDVICTPTIEGAHHELHWRVRLRGDLESDRRAELRAIVGELALRLKQIGSAVSEPDIRSQQARLTERFVIADPTAGVPHDSD